MVLSITNRYIYLFVVLYLPFRSRTHRYTKYSLATCECKFLLKINSHLYTCNNSVLTDKLFTCICPQLCETRARYAMRGKEMEDLLGPSIDVDNSVPFLKYIEIYEFI